MLILQVVPDVGHESAGPSYSVPGMCRGLALAGVDVELLSLDWGRGREFPFKSTLCRRDRTILPRKLGCSAEMRHALSDACGQVDVIHSNSLWMMPCVYPGRVVSQYRRAQRGVGPKCVCSPRGAIATWTLSKNRFFKKVFGTLFQWPALRAVDMFHATSIKEYEEIRRAGFVQPVALVPIGMDIPESKSPSRRITESSDGKRKVVFFGRLHAVKAVDRLVQAWEILTKGADHFDWELVIAGPDRGIRGELETYVADRRIPRVRFVGELRGQAKYDFLASADLYVLPSLSENFGITIAEALACGTPVIASKGCPWPGLVDHHCGWWVDNTPEVLAATLREAILLEESSPVGESHLAQMGMAGREWISKDYSWQGIGEKMKSAYDWLLHGGPIPDCVILD